MRFQRNPERAGSQSTPTPPPGGTTRSDKSVQVGKLRKKTSQGRAIAERDILGTVLSIVKPQRQTVSAGDGNTSQEVA